MKTRQIAVQIIRKPVIALALICLLAIAVKTYAASGACGTLPTNSSGYWDCTATPCSYLTCDYNIFCYTSGGTTYYCKDTGIQINVTVNSWVQGTCTVNQPGSISCNNATLNASYPMYPTYKSAYHCGY